MARSSKSIRQCDMQEVPTAKRMRIASNAACDEESSEQGKDLADSECSDEDVPQFPPPPAWLPLHSFKGEAAEALEGLVAAIEMSGLQLE
eukprot:982338-Amphidinium_carterae.1